MPMSCSSTPRTDRVEKKVSGEQPSRNLPSPCLATTNTHPAPLPLPLSPLSLSFPTDRRRIAQSSVVRPSRPRNDLIRFSHKSASVSSTRPGCTVPVAGWRLVRETRNMHVQCHARCLLRGKGSSKGDSSWGERQRTENRRTFRQSALHGTRRWAAQQTSQPKEEDPTTSP